MLIPSSHNFSMFVGCLVASHLTYDPHHLVPNGGYIARLLALDSHEEPMELWVDVSNQQLLLGSSHKGE
ncbi:hypothetical protein MTR_5g038890 [Medicago truncatula]|uniref:Uncharacterized protein n=1 Tax=Medicago truncatula TaxID=3880 RepID=G7KB49_MEDTR|nr:hypothetical protein MTR_5g038890 [Medicago truncatula]